MPRRALRCAVDINIHAVTCPGVWLPRRDDLYLSVQLFNQLRQTQLSSPIFPLLYHEKFRFDKVFYTAFEPSQVAESLEYCTVLIELIQLSDIYEGGRLMATYEGNARDFLYPYPSYSSSYGTQDRDVLMERSLDFPGISPRLEFSTRTVLQETDVPLLATDEDIGLYSTGRTSRASARQSRSRTRTPVKTGDYKKATISSISRSRSMSPSLRLRLDALDLENSYRTPDIKPPFVVRKVAKDLIGRIPKGSGPDLECSHIYKSPRRSSSGSGSLVQSNNKGKKHRKGKGKRSVGRYSYDDSLYDYLYGPYSSRISQVVRQPGTEPYPLYSSRYNYYTDPLDSDDKEVARLTSADYDYYSRPRTTSPVLYRSSLSDRYDERPWSLAKSDLISSRVERALSRNRSLERLDRLSDSPYSGSSYGHYDESLDSLARDFERARHRRYYP